MVKQHILIFLICLTAFAKITIHNNPHNFVPKNEQEYVQYLNIMLGKHHEEASLSQQLVKLYNQHRPSLLNAAKKIIMILAPTEAEAQSAQISQQIEGKDMSKLMASHQEHFSIKLLSNGNEEELQKQIQKHEQPDTLIQVIRGGKSQIHKLCSRLEQTMMKQSPRRLEQSHAIQAGQQDSTYVIKFFFSIMFVLVCIGCVGFIIDSDSKKDTLLYAKFIADVGNIR